MLKHVGDHAKEFGLTRWEDYIELSQDFWKRAKAAGFEVKLDNKGIIRIYDEATNTLGVYSPDFKAFNLFKPYKNRSKAAQLRYWARQAGELVSPWW